MAWAEDTVGRRQYVVKVMELGHAQDPSHRAAQRGKQRRLGRRQPDLLLHREGSEDAARVPRAQPLDSTAPNHTDVAADPVVWTQEDESFYTQLVQAPRTRNTCSSTRRARCRRKCGTRMPTIREAELQGVPAARARSRIPGGARQRPLDRAHQLPGEELPHRRGARTAPKAIARSGRTSSRIATTPSSTRSTCRANSSPSKSIRAACASCAFVPGAAAADVFVTADEPSYTMALDVNREFDSDKLRYTYTSPW